MKIYRAAQLLALPSVLLLLAHTASAQMPGSPVLKPSPNRTNPGSSRPAGPPFGIPGDIPDRGRVRSRDEEAHAINQQVFTYIKMGDTAAKARPPNYKLAEWAYWRAVELDPKQLLAYEGLGKVFAARQLYRDALLAYEQALQLKPKKAELHFQSAVMLLKLGETDAARERLQLLRDMKKQELAAKLEALLSPPPGRNVNQ